MIAHLRVIGPPTRLPTVSEYVTPCFQTPGTDVLGSTFESDFTVPQHLAPGNYVLRHEIIALHAAGQANGAQNYPQVRSNNYLEAG